VPLCTGWATSSVALIGTALRHAGRLAPDYASPGHDALTFQHNPIVPFGCQLRAKLPDRFDPPRRARQSSRRAGPRSGYVAIVMAPNWNDAVRCRGRGNTTHNGRPAIVPAPAMAVGNEKCRARKKIAAPGNLDRHASMGTGPTHEIRARVIAAWAISLHVLQDLLPQSPQWHDATQHVDAGGRRRVISRRTAQ